MKNKYILLPLMMAVASSIPSYAVSAYPGEIQYSQPDGSQLTVCIRGNENLHWYETTKGEMLMPTAEGMLIPATMDFKQRMAHKRVAPQAVAPSPYTTFPTLGRQKALVLLVEFSDKKFTYKAEDFRDMLCSTGYSAYGAAGSARDYFVENSAGRFIPEFEVFGPVTLSNPMSYYGGNDDALAHQMVSEACSALDGQIDFSQYDRDGDGWADNVYVFYAGYGEADGGGVNSVWPHSANLFNKGIRLNLDGVGIGSYSCSNELIGGTSRLVGIGTFCHEFSHVLGLPDLYSTNNNSAFTPYYYSLMDHGNYNGDSRCPCALTIYERYFLGWAEPVELTGEGTVRLEPVQNNRGYRVTLPGFSEEYYIAEYRKKEGWDAYLPGEGMLIWRIDYSKDVWDRNAVNNDEGRQRVDLIEADGSQTLLSSAGDVFPGTSGKTSFSDFRDHLGAKYEVAFNNIRKEGDAVIFDYNSASTIPVQVSGMATSDIDDEEFILSWNAVEGADGYIVNVWENAGSRLEPVADYMAMAVDATEVKVSGLSPETAYSFDVRALKGFTTGIPSQSGAVETAEPGIGYFAPVAHEADNIHSAGFTANWEAMDKAEEYVIDVYMKSEEAAATDIAAFSTPLTLPEGWTTTANTTMSVKGYYGETAPSLRFSQNAEMIETPVYDTEITSISFWDRGYKADASATLTLSVFTGGNWKEVKTFTGVSNTAGETEQWTAEPGQKVYAARIRYQGPAGSSICVDDITVNFGMAQVKKPVLEKHAVGNVTNYAVTSLAPNTAYTYIVRGKKGEKLSLPSEEIEVTTNNVPTGIENLEAEQTRVRIFTLTGVEVTGAKELPSGIYIEQRGDEVVKVAR